MTTANSTTRAARIAAAGLLGALALTACDSGSGSGSDSGTKNGTSPTAGASATSDGKGGPEGTGNTGGPAAESGGLNGSWLATSGGRAVVLIVSGGRVALFSTDRTTCSGAVREQPGKDVIRLSTCKRRAEGTVDSVNKTTLQVTWAGGLGRETYTRAQGGALPSGLPTAGLGS